MRPIEMSDAPVFYSYRSNAEINQYQGFIPKSIEETESFISKLLKSEFGKGDSWFQFAVIKRSSNSMIGDIGVHFIGKDSFQAEIGGTLMQEEHKKGYAIESLKRVMEYLFVEHNKHRIIASIDPRNKASINMVESLGMRKEAHFVKSYRMNDEWVDDVIYAILNEEWKKSLP